MVVSELRRGYSSFVLVLGVASAVACGSGGEGSGDSSTGDGSGGGYADNLSPNAAAGANPYSLPGSGGSASTLPPADTATASGGPRFPGAGTSGAAAPLQSGIGPETADDCAGGGPPPDGSYGVAEGEVATLCFYSPDEPAIPGATIEQIIEVIDNVEYLHIRLTLDPRFVDNSYGENAIGWEDSRKGEHTFRDLVGSDHAEIQVLDGNGDTAIHFGVDYVSEDPASPSGYGSLGVTGGEGEMIVGDAADILGVATSLDRNLNGCGLETFTESSPAVADGYTVSDTTTSDWDFRVVYEVWIDTHAFGDAGVGQAIIEFIHASPSKTGDNTVEVDPGDCPPDWGCYSPLSAEGKCL